MALQIVCVERKGKKPKHRHVSAIGVQTPQVVIRFSVKTIRKIIKKGTVDFYCVGLDGVEVPVRRYKCSCGAKTIRILTDDIDDGYLSRLPSCPRPNQLRASGVVSVPTPAVSSPRPS